jgi:hypothetical protein
MEEPESDDEEITSPKRKRHSSRRSREKSVSGSKSPSGSHGRGPVVEDPKVRCTFYCHCHCTFGDIFAPLFHHCIQQFAYRSFFLTRFAKNDTVAGKRRHKSGSKSTTSPVKLSAGHDSSKSSHTPLSSPHDKAKSKIPKLSLRDDAETDFESPLPPAELELPPKANSPRKSIGESNESGETSPGRRVTKNIRRDCTRKLLQENPDELVYEDDEHGKKGTS